MPADHVNRQRPSSAPPSRGRGVERRRADVAAETWPVGAHSCGAEDDPGVIGGDDEEHVEGTAAVAPEAVEGDTSDK